SSDTRGWGAKTEAESIRTVGGDLAQGGGWSVPDHTEVPVLLDLRPIDELLSPVFFDDRLVWTRIRSRLHTRLNQNSEPTNDQNLTSRLVSVRLLQLSNYGPSDLPTLKLGIAAAAYFRKQGAADWEPIEPSQSPDLEKLGADLALGRPEQIAVRSKDPPQVVRDLATSISRMYPTSIPQWAARRLYNYSEVTRKLRPGAGGVVGADIDVVVYDKRRDAVRDHFGWFRNDHNLGIIRTAVRRDLGDKDPGGPIGNMIEGLVVEEFIKTALPALVLTGEMEPLTVSDARAQDWLDPGNDLVREAVVDALLSELRNNPARVVGGFRGTRFDPGVTLQAVGVDKPYLARMPAATDSDDRIEYMIQFTFTGDGSDKLLSDVLTDPRTSIEQLGLQPMTSLLFISLPKSRVDIVDVVDSNGVSLSSASAATYVYRQPTGAAADLRIRNDKSPRPILQIYWTPPDQVISGTVLLDFYNAFALGGLKPSEPVRLHLSFAIEQPLLLD
ncbi:MAG: hypothetical protein NT069_33260, partial [Planctomycetota bacterium]|nr:hypothetical protein [Planctomycetota bacterium]